MRNTTAALVGMVAVSFAAAAAPSAEVLDLAARVLYGFYHAEARAIDTAAEALDRLGDAPDVLYWRDFAALRRAQLGANDRAGAERLRACVEREAPPKLDKRVAAEAW